MCNTEADPELTVAERPHPEGQLVPAAGQGPDRRPDGHSRRPVGDLLAQRRRRQDGGALYRTRIDGEGEPDRLTDGGDGGDADPVVSPDGQQIAFSRISGPSGDIMTAPFDGKSADGDARVRTERRKQPGRIVVTGRAADRVQDRAGQQWRPRSGRPGERRIQDAWSTTPRRTPYRPGRHADRWPIRLCARLAGTLAGEPTRGCRPTLDELPFRTPRGADAVSTRC